MSILSISLSPYHLHRRLRLVSPSPQSSSLSLSSFSSSLVKNTSTTLSLSSFNLSSSSFYLPSSSSSSVSLPSSSSPSSFSCSSSATGFFPSFPSTSSSSSLHSRDFSVPLPSHLSSLGALLHISQKFLSHIPRKCAGESSAFAAERKLSSSPSNRQERKEEEERGDKEREEEEEAREEKEEGNLHVSARREGQERYLHQPLELHEHFSQSRDLAKENEDKHQDPKKKKKGESFSSSSLKKGPSLSSRTFLALEDKKNKGEEEALLLGSEILQSFFDCTPSQWLDALRGVASICPQNRFGHEHRYRWRQETQSKIQLAKLDAYEWGEKRKKKKRWTDEIEREHEDEEKKEKETSSLSSSSSSFSPYRKLTGKWKKGEEKKRRKEREEKDERNPREAHNSLHRVCLNRHGEKDSSSLSPSSSSSSPSLSTPPSLSSSPSVSSSLSPSSFASASSSRLSLPLLLLPGDFPVECLLWRSYRFLPYLNSRQLVQLIEIADRLHFHDGRNLYHPSASSATLTSLSHLSSDASLSFFSLPSSSSSSPLPDLRAVLLREVMARLTRHTETYENKEEEEREGEHLTSSPSSVSSSSEARDESSSSTCHQSMEGSPSSRSRDSSRKRRREREERVHLFSLREIHIIVKYFASHVPAEIAGVLDRQGEGSLLGEKEREERHERGDVLNGRRFLGDQREEGEENERRRRRTIGRMKGERTMELERERFLSEFRMEDLLRSPEGKVFVIRQELACLFRLLLRSAISQLARLSDKKEQKHRDTQKDSETHTTQDLQEKKERSNDMHLHLSAHRVRKRETYGSDRSDLSPLEPPSTKLTTTCTNATPEKILDRHHGVSSTSSPLSFVASDLSLSSSSSSCSTLERSESTSSLRSRPPPFHENMVVPLLEACGKLQLVYLQPSFLRLLSLSFSSFLQSKSLLNIAKAFQFACKVEIPIEDLIAQKNGLFFHLLQRLSQPSEFFTLLYQERSPSAAQVALGQLGISMLYFLESTRQSIMEPFLSQQEEEEEKKKARDFYTHLLRLQEEVLYHILESVYLYVHWERMVLSPQLDRRSTRREGDSEREREKEGKSSKDDLNEIRATPTELLRNSRFSGGEEEEERDSFGHERLAYLDSQTEENEARKKEKSSYGVNEEKRRKIERIVMCILKNRKKKEKVTKKSKDLGELSPFLHRQIQTIAVAISLENPFLSSKLQRHHEEEEDQEEEEEEERRGKEEKKEEEECRDKKVSSVREEKESLKPLMCIAEKKKKKERSLGLSIGDMLYILLEATQPKDCVYIQKESSMHHSNISSTLRSLGVRHNVEVSRDPYVLDLLLSTRNTCIEVDGPLHFLTPRCSSSLPSSSLSSSRSSSFPTSKQSGFASDSIYERKEKNDEERKDLGGGRVEINEKVRTVSDPSEECLFLYDHKSRLKHRLLTKCGVHTLHIAWFDWPKRSHNQKTALIQLLSNSARQDQGERRQNASRLQTHRIYPSSLSSSSSLFSSSSSNSCEEDTPFTSALSSSCRKQEDHSLSFSCSFSPSFSNVEVYGENSGEDKEGEEKEAKDREEKDKEEGDREEKHREEKDNPPLQEICLHATPAENFIRRDSTPTAYTTGTATGPLSLPPSSSSLSGRENLSLLEKKERPLDRDDEGDRGRRHDNSTDSLKYDRERRERRDLGGYQDLRVYRPMFTRLCRSETFSFSSFEIDEETKSTRFQDYDSLVYEEDPKEDAERDSCGERKSDRFVSSSSSSSYGYYPSELPIFLEND
ncbi:rap domain-containing protein [Cystoisospora suis]|uniref:Rap domain-containing protein n=1 Tax=Cystoisospora suis TaxID=483139 RepID=A0A2C6KS07_9APIC|nr:rap domain-containing protein [Cystoisospora suis]